MKLQSLKTTIAQLFAILALLALVGCAAQPQPDASPAPVKKERPEWAMNEPDEENGIMSFVGVSLVHSTEQKARVGAREAANTNAVQYLGTMVRGKVERISSSFGLASETIDETLGGRSFQKQLYAGVAKRLKSKKWHFEEKTDAKGKPGYIYFVLTQIPKSELDNTINGAANNTAKAEREKAKKSLNEEAKQQALDSAKFFEQMGQDKSS